MKPKVTIGICIRNCQDFIRETIKSIITQDFPHKLMEVIFVDDGSEDNTLSIVKEYVPKMGMQVKLFSHEWKGLGYSRNVVINSACGDYIIWVDGDIILPTNYVTMMVEFMEKRPDVAIAGGSYGMLNQKNLAAFLDNVEYVAYRCKSGTNSPGTGGAIYRTETVKQIGGFDENIKGSGEDIDIAYRLVNAGWTVVRDLATFYALGKKGWKDYWNHSIWHGYGAHYVKHKNTRIMSLSKMSLPIALIGGIVYSVTAYKVLKRKKVFLLPLYSIFKNAAWWIGFLKGHINEYGHDVKQK